jgi:hypothetical protein
MTQSISEALRQRGAAKTQSSLKKTAERSATFAKKRVAALFQPMEAQNAGNTTESTPDATTVTALAKASRPQSQIGPEASPFSQSACPIWPRVRQSIAAVQCGDSKAEG